MRTALAPIISVLLYLEVGVVVVGGGGGWAVAAHSATHTGAWECQCAAPWSVVCRLPPSAAHTVSMAVVFPLSSSLPCTADPFLDPPQSASGHSTDGASCSDASSGDLKREYEALGARKRQLKDLIRQVEQQEKV